MVGKIFFKTFLPFGIKDEDEMLARARSKNIMAREYRPKSRAR